MEGPPASLGAPITGDYACACIHTLTRRLGRLRAEVLVDRDPEPLHQLRVSLRRLRSVLKLFGPALSLPEGVSEARLADVARHTSLTRDLDVLALLLRSELAPALPDREQGPLKRALRQLGRDRKQGFATLVETLEGQRYLKLLARLRGWVREPRVTALGSLPLRPWAAEWLAPVCAGLFLEQGWLSEDPQDPSLHALRKRLKAVRYALDTLQPFLEPALLAWLDTFKAAQDHLGDIHDLQVMTQTLQREGKGAWRREPLPVLQLLLEQRAQGHWQRWLHLRDAHIAAPRRRAFHQALAQMGGD
ncbi:MAG: CHAD domain-containing protein [Cyanobacteriota bacterium]|jgi:CHAD domain-containing protein